MGAGRVQVRGILKLLSVNGEMVHWHRCLPLLFPDLQRWYTLLLVAYVGRKRCLNGLENKQVAKQVAEVFELVLWFSMPMVSL